LFKIEWLSRLNKEKSMDSEGKTNVVPARGAGRRNSDLQVAQSQEPIFPFSPKLNPPTPGLKA
jgi:hypothetical protein